MSVCPSDPAPAPLRSFPHLLASIGFDPAPRPVWPVVAQTLPVARLAFRPTPPTRRAEAPSWADHP